MKVSQYNYIATKGAKNIIFNGVTCSCAVLTVEEFSSLQQLKLSEQEAQNYLHLGFIVEDNVNELDRLLYLNRLADSESVHVGFRILTTTACNARCPYCYESGFGFVNMTDNVANDTAEYIMKRARNKKKLIVQWFGGEPLCNIPAIDRISEYIIPKTRDLSIAYKSQMVSNGYLFTDELVRHAYADWNLRLIQITLDGLKQVYERVKGFSSPNAFERVIRNIHYLLNVGITVAIRLNYDDDNKNEIKNLIRFLSKEYNGCKNLSVYAYRLFDSLFDKEVDIELRSCLRENGFYNNPLYRINRQKIACMARSLNSYTIMPNGDIAKCCRSIKASNGIIGSIYKDKYFDNISC